MDAAFASDNPLEAIVDSATDGRNDTHPGDNDSTTHSDFRFQGSSRRLFNVINRFAHRLDFFRDIVRNIDIEFFFQLHHEFDCIQRIRPQIIDEMGCAGNLFLFDTELLGDNVEDAFLNRCHHHLPPTTLLYQKYRTPDPTVSAGRPYIQAQQDRGFS
jgi:hypothetical protein